MKVRVFAPGSIGNVGPGFDILGMAVDGFGDEFTFDFSVKNYSINIFGIGADKIPRMREANAACIAADAILRKYDSASNYSLRIDRSLPLSGGMGASAAASVAGALAASHYLGKYSEVEILQAALEAERHVAGYHLDNIAPCLLGGVSLVHHVHPPNVSKVPFNQRFQLVIFMPDLTLDTKFSRSLLPDTLPTKIWVQQMAQTAGVILGLMQGDEAILKTSLKDEYAEPQRAPLIPGFYKAKQEALAAGAINFTISGGGPSCFSLCDENTDIIRLLESVPKAFEVSCQAKLTKISTTGAYCH